MQILSMRINNSGGAQRASHDVIGLHLEFPKKKAVVQEQIPLYFPYQEQFADICFQGHQQKHKY